MFFGGKCLKKRGPCTPGGDAGVQSAVRRRLSGLEHDSTKSKSATGRTKGVQEITAVGVPDRNNVTNNIPTLHVVLVFALALLCGYLFANSDVNSPFFLDLTKKLSR